MSVSRCAHNVVSFIQKQVHQLTRKEMFALKTLLHAVLFQCTLGEDYCSSSINGKVKCAPCSKVCPTHNIPCNAKSFCPSQCGQSIAASECNVVCADNCLDGKCEYIDGYLNCKGCKPEFTGQTCNENCALNCLKCYQNDSTCIKCKGNSRPPNCRETYETASNLPSTFSFVDISLTNCTSINCYICPSGYYGHTCENACTHCNSSLCAKDTSCLECISNLSNSECVTAWTEFKTTTMSENCTDPDCYQVPERSDDHDPMMYMYIAMSTAVSLLVIVAIGVAYRRCRGRKQNIIRDGLTVNDNVEDRVTPPLPILVEISSEDSGPYAFISVIDRDYVPDHIYQAALVTAPSVDQ